MFIILFVENTDSNAGKPIHLQPRDLRKRRPRPGQKISGMTDKTAAYEAILNGEKHLVDLKIDGTTVYGVFCRVEWHLHKENPSKFPMFRFLIANSPDCREDRKVHVNLREVVQFAHQRDDQVHLLQLGGVVFHESRCGSTLTANLLASWRPAQHRVYSESPPPITALLQLCGENFERCPLENAAQLLQDVMYLMRRSDDPRETHAFFKIQSSGTRMIRVFQAAFPDTPYMFVYRDPIQVIMSYFKDGSKKMAGNCLKHKRSPPPRMRQVLDTYGWSKKAEDVCAAHLAAFTESVAESLTDYGTPVNYRDMPDILFDTVFPQWTPDLPITEEELARMRETAGVYSKSGKDKGAPAHFAGDSEQKEHMASDAVKEAAAHYMEASYQQLEALAQQRKW